ncbi:MAG TPA: DUF3394 domain-containing protein, partial [Rhodospirillales bacterium]|nr:DUF3394 domain-containing protein [Rhodospirillales bacterium]
GLPTTANYLVVAALLANVVVEIGEASGYVLPLIAVHLFVFYFGLMADVTPPVGLAAYAAAGISRADPIKTGIQAFWYEIRTAILPFVFIFNPELLLIGITGFWHGLSIFILSLIAILCFTAATQGWLLTRLKLSEILCLLVVTVALFRPDFVVNLVSPVYEPLGESIKSPLAFEEKRNIRIHVTRNTEYGDRFKLFYFPTRKGESFIIPDYLGINLRTSEGGYFVDQLTYRGLAKNAGIEIEDQITSTEISNLNPLGRVWGYGAGLLLLALIGFFQWRRWRNKENTS